MPEIRPDVWKMGLSFFWYREHLDGTIEQEFNVETGKIALWGAETPRDLRRVGWLPMTPDLAAKIAVQGETGYPVHAPKVFIDIFPGEELICFKDCAVVKGYKLICKVCQKELISVSDVTTCRDCGSSPILKCDFCGKELVPCPKVGCNDCIRRTQVDIDFCHGFCPDCDKQGRYIDPIKREHIKWEEVLYNLGIKDEFQIRFNRDGLFVQH